jgi:L-aminopeptidase/D-esterase-like protein
MTLTTVPGIRVGHAEVLGGRSGCTVVLGPFRGAVEIRGMATGSRELDLLSPYHLVERVNGIVLSGGSAHGLAAADGVMAWLEEAGEGFDTGAGLVPLVPAAVVFDLTPGVPRPGPLEGRRACEAASGTPVREGRIGAGAGATVGKLYGPEWASPGGLGSAAQSVGDGSVAALAVVNPLGTVVAEDGSILAGSRVPERSPDGGGGGIPPLPLKDPMAGTNTTLVVVATDLPVSRLGLGRVARMATGAFPRAISPVNTPFDGDILFTLSTHPDEKPFLPGEMLELGEAAREVTEEAIRRAVSAERRGDA